MEKLVCTYLKCAEIKAKEWEAVFPNEILYSQKLFLTMEQSFPNIDYTYLCIRLNDEMLTIIPCFTYKLQLDVVAPSLVQSVGKAIRRVYKNYLTVKVLVIGSYIATCENYIPINDKILQYSEEITCEVKKLAKIGRCKMVMIKEVPHIDLSRVKKLLPDFTYVDSLPNNYIPMTENFRPYPYMLRKKERQRYRRAKRDFERNKLKFEIIYDYDDISEQAFHLYKAVLDKSKTKFECLNPDFFRTLNSNFSKDIYLLVIKDERGDIKCVELIFECKDKLIPIYIGIDYSYKDVKCLYFNVINKSIEIAQEKSLKAVVLGQNSYAPKVRSGALISRGFLGYYSSSWLLSFLIRRTFKYLFPKFKNIYGTHYKEEALEYIKTFADNQRITISS